MTTYRELLSHLKKIDEKQKEISETTDGVKQMLKDDLDHLLDREI